MGKISWGQQFLVIGVEGSVLVDHPRPLMGEVGPLGQVASLLSWPPCHT